MVNLPFSERKLLFVSRLPTFPAPPVPQHYREFYEAVWPERKHPRRLLLFVVVVVVRAVVVPIVRQPRKRHLDVPTRKAAPHAPHSAGWDVVVGGLPVDEVARRQGGLQGQVRSEGARKETEKENKRRRRIGRREKERGKEQAENNRERKDEVDQSSPPQSKQQQEDTTRVRSPPRRRGRRARSHWPKYSCWRRLSPRPGS